MIQWRCIQYDVSRGRIPRLSTVEERLSHVSPAGANALLLYLECVVETETFPAVGPGATPITAEYLCRLAAICRRYQVEPIPLIQILGHQGNLLARQEFAHLGELSPPVTRFAGANSFLPHSPEVRQRVKAWLDELLPLFDSPFVHVGLDETFLLGTDRSREIVGERGAAAVLADYLLDFHAFLRERGKRMMIYADPLIHFPELRDLLPTDIVVTNWGYGRESDVYEQDNQHFANHAAVTARPESNWVVGNNMAEYVFTPFQRLEANTSTWLGLAEESAAEGYVISDWGSYDNVNPHVLSIIGDLYILWRLDTPELNLDSYLDRLAGHLLGRPDAGFASAMRIMLLAQMNPAYVQDERLLRYLPLLPSLLLADPASGSPSSQRLACLREDGLLAFEAAMREAVAAMDAIDTTGAPYPLELHDLRMLARRLLMVALRARLWHDCAWDTGAIWHSQADLAPRQHLLAEYGQLAEADLTWYATHWDRTNLLSARDEALAALRLARESMTSRVNSLVIPNTRYCHS